MRPRIIAACVLTWLFLPQLRTVVAQSPQILSLSPDGTVVWTNPVPGNLAIFERSTNVAGGDWEPFFYDWGTNGLLTTHLPWATSGASTFYRVGVRTNTPDPSLVMHLSFDNDFPAGTVLDLSGHGNHGRRYGRPGFPTNWPSITSGPDGSQAAEFRYYYDGYGTYGRSGDYIGIPASSNFTNMPQATISAWAHYYASPDNNVNYDHNSALLNSGQQVPGTWLLGRLYSSNTRFVIELGPSSAVSALSFPDTSPTGNSTNWHLYTVTFSNGLVRGFWDGKHFATTTVPVSTLTMAGTYIGVSCWTFNVSPELNLAIDQNPNNAWINGRVDDLRIYSRALSEDEVFEYYRSFDKLPPSAPEDLVATPVSSSQIALRWRPAADLFAITGYVIRRNGLVVATNVGTVWFDAELPANSTNTYRIQALDLGNNLSNESAEATAVTLGPQSVDLIIDDADSGPWFSTQGSWRLFTVWPGYHGATSLYDYKDVKGWSLTFRPPLPEPGQYSVYIRYPGLAAQTYQVSTSVPVDVVHAGQTNTVSLNQRLNYGTWLLLGQFFFDPGTNSYVRVRTEGTDGYFVLGDAVRFVK
jgi:hypothetical protein